MSRSLLLSASLLALAATTACSSSNATSGSPGQDSGTTTENDGSTGNQDSGTTQGDSGAGGDTGTTMGTDGSTGGTCTPATDAGTYASVTYVPAVKGQNKCVTADIQAFVAACVTSTNQADCPNWFAANVAGQAADGGGAGTTCGNCIAPTGNNGGAWIDPFGYVNPNYAGCIQLTDTAGGAACAAAFNDVNGCTDLYCDQCTTNSGFGDCTSAASATGGSCASYDSTFNTACANDLGIIDGGTAAAACFPSMGAPDNSADYTYILNLICGTGM